MGEGTEFDRQVQRLVSLGYAELAGITVEELVGLCEPLREAAREVGPTHADDVALPFVLVVKAELVPTVAAVERWEVRGKAGWTDMADELDSYLPIESVEIPDGPVYLLHDVRTGRDSLGVPPSQALDLIAERGRTPLTIDEGVAVMTHAPDVLDRLHAFQALASRAPNKRVPSFWWSKGAPRLGWCWWNNPHSWMGSASASRRVDPARPVT